MNARVHEGEATLFSNFIQRAQVFEISFKIPPMVLSCGW